MVTRPRSLKWVGVVGLTTMGEGRKSLFSAVISGHFPKM